VLRTGGDERVAIRTFDGRGPIFWSRRTGMVRNSRELDGTDDAAELERRAIDRYAVALLGSCRSTRVSALEVPDQSGAGGRNAPTGQLAKSTEAGLHRIPRRSH
jgi:hypothetical protein